VQGQKPGDGNRSNLMLIQTNDPDNNADLHRRTTFPANGSAANP